MDVIGLDRIKEAVQTIDLLPVIEAGFVAYAAGKAVVPPVGELVFREPPGDVHIKYGYLTDDAYYVIKIASGFYENPALNLPSSNGLMLLFSRQTGALSCILMDEGYLTDLRTAVAGAIAARYLAPRRVHRIGVVGTGTQARLQLRYLTRVTDCRDAVVWGRQQDRLMRYREDMTAEGFTIAMTQDMDDVAASCNLIVTTTASTTPLIQAGQLRRGTHVTAVGADTPEKQELDPALLGEADLVVADSRAQCVVRGEIAHAVRGGVLDRQDLVELGEILAGSARGRTSDDQITVADLTGVAVQDIQIAKAVYEAVRTEPMNEEETA